MTTVPFEALSAKTFSWRPSASITSARRLQRRVVTITAGEATVDPVPVCAETIDWMAEAAIWGDETRSWAEASFEAASQSWPTE